MVDGILQHHQNQRSSKLVPHRYSGKVNHLSIRLSEDHPLRHHPPIQMTVTQNYRLVQIQECIHAIHSLEVLFLLSNYSSRFRCFFYLLFFNIYLLFALLLIFEQPTSFSIVILHFSRGSKQIFYLFSNFRLPSQEEF